MSRRKRKTPVVDRTQAADQARTDGHAIGPGTELRRFTIDYFTFFGAVVHELDEHHQGPLQIELPDELVDFFGAPRLQVAFHQVTPGSEVELIAHGSRLFDRMLTLLDRRGALTIQALPNRYTSSQELLSAIRPLNAGIVDLKLREEMQSRYLFNWRITYRADDKREELYTVMLDEDGDRVHLLDSTAEKAADSPDTASAELSPVASNGAENGAGLAPKGASTHEPSKLAGEAVVLERLWADAAPLPVEMDDDGNPLPPHLPPMTHLTRLAETARKYAIYHADVRCVSHEAEIMPRLHKVLNRLTSYYRQQIEEVYDSHDPSGEKRRNLELELEHKLAEEVENHRLRVQVTLFGYAIVQTPVAIASITLSDGQRQAEIEVVRNRYTGHMQTPTCHACNQSTATPVLDRNGHICCDDCVCQCNSCQDILCAACGVESCPVCGKENCDQCGLLCWACGERACAEHVARCPTCGDAVCLACQSACAACDTMQCRSHLRSDAVLTVPTPHETNASEPVDSEAVAQPFHALICPDCAVRCPGCQQYSVQLGLCASSGRRYCLNCLVTCHACNKQVGPGYYERDPANGKPYCSDCLERCQACGALASTALDCTICGEVGCANCLGRCEFCRGPMCHAHLAAAAGCGHQLCQEHRPNCQHCEEAVCPVCFEPCAICETYHCHEHVAICRRCDQVYCKGCVKRNRLCDTCNSLEQEGVGVELADERWITDPQAAELIDHYDWRRVGNRRFDIYVGENSFLSRAVIVVRRNKKGGHVVLAQRLGIDDRLRDLFGD